MVSPASDSETRENGAVDWPRLMRLGLGLLRLPPDVFWAMTPREFDAALTGAFGIEPGASATMVRAEFEALSALFPDVC